MLASGSTLPNSRHPLVRQQSDTARQALSRQESGSSRGVPDPSASLDAIHPADRASPHASGTHLSTVLIPKFQGRYLSDPEHGVTSGSATPTGTDSPGNQVWHQLNHEHTAYIHIFPGESSSLLP